MPVEGRDRQDLALNTGTRPIHRDGFSDEHEGKQGVLFPDRWLRIGYAARRKNAVFNNVMCHINEASLCEAFRALDGSKARGIDGISKKEYGRNLEDNIANLARRIHNGSYKPQVKREVLIPKANGKMRPIAISSFEDKLVDWVVGRILTILYEPLFIRNSFGFRPSKSAHGAIEAIYYTLKDNRRPYVVEIDFASFFNTIPHGRLLKIISKRVTDRRFKGLIGRFLKVGILEQSGNLKTPEVGTPQGSIMSPILANIYLHEVLDSWFLMNHASYNNIIVRYADDVVFFFKDKGTAERFINDLFRRTEAYGLQLNRDKTKTICFDKNLNNSFDFLGFTFYWATKHCSERRELRVKTQKKTLLKKIQEFYYWIKEVRNQMKLREIWKIARTKIKGHYNYYGFWMNRTRLYHYYSEATKSLYKWLNRRSQRRSFNWVQFQRKLQYNKIPVPPEIGQLKQLGWNPYAL
jgi:RNA-directed DNA polymerase